MRAAAERRVVTTSMEIVPPAGPVPAGRTFPVTVRLRSEPVLDLEGLPLEILAPGGQPVGSAVGALVDGANESSLDLEAPMAVGPATFTLRLADHGADGTSVLGCEVHLDITVRAHRVSLSAWDVSDRLEVGEAPSLTVGVKCLDGCVLAESPVEILDEAGSAVATTRTGGTPWPKTQSLFWSRVDLPAPDGPGDHRWRIRWRDASAPDAALPPHDAAEHVVTTRTVTPPAHTVTVRLLDRETGAGIEGATIRVGPYQAPTGAEGLARLRLPHGPASLATWKPGYLPLQTGISVEGDAELTLEAEKAPPDDIDTFWV
jgi:hypothetical protein